MTKENPTNVVQEWEKRFDRRFVSFDAGPLIFSELRAFINELLKAHGERCREEGRREAVDYIEAHAPKDTFIAVGEFPKEFRGETYYIVPNKRLQEARTLQTPQQENV